MGSSFSSSPLRASQGKDLSPEARERRKRIGILLRRASKKSQSQLCHSPYTQDPAPTDTSSPSASTDSPQPTPILENKKAPLKKVSSGLQETVCLSPLVEEQDVSPDFQSQLHSSSSNVPEEVLNPRAPREGYSSTANTFLQKKKSPGQARESFEMEEASWISTVRLQQNTNCMLLQTHSHVKQCNLNTKSLPPVDLKNTSSRRAEAVVSVIIHWQPNCLKFSDSRCKTSLFSNIIFVQSMNIQNTCFLHTNLINPDFNSALPIC